MTASRGTKRQACLIACSSWLAREHPSGPFRLFPNRTTVPRVEAEFPAIRMGGTRTFTNGNNSRS